MRKYIPVLILVVVALGLLALYGPGAYQRYLFLRTASQFSNSVKAGDTQTWLGMIEPDQQQLVQPHAMRLPADYQQHIASFKLTRYEQTDPDTVWAIFTCRLAEDSGEGIYQGKLRWHWQDKHWVWDFTGSFAAPLAASGEPDWIKIEDLLRLAEAL